MKKTMIACVMYVASVLPNCSNAQQPAVNGIIAQQAKSVWDSLAAKGLAAPFDKATTMQALKQYYAQIAAVDNTNPAVADAAIRKIDEGMPEALKLLTAINPNSKYANNVNFNNFGWSLKYQRELQITPQQAIQIYNKANVYETKAKLYESKPDSFYFDKGQFQIAELSRILSNAQYTNLFYYKHADKAIQQAKNDWRQLTEKGWEKGYSKDSLIAVFKQYHAEELAINDRVGNVDRAKASTEIKQLELRMPLPLKMLTVTNPRNKYANNINYNNFGWSLKYQKELQVTLQQALQLWDKAKDYERKSIAFTNRPDSFAFDKDRFQAEEVPKILTDSQYMRLLVIKHTDKANQLAKTSWREIEERGLNEGNKYHKDSTINKLTAYFLQQLVVGEKYNYDTDKRKQYLQYIERTMTPEALAILRRSKNGGNLGQYVW